MNDQESFAMWKLYCSAQEGVAIQSSFTRLADSLAEYPEDVYVGMVKYTTYDTDEIPTGNDFYRFLFKRSSFSHEQELRAIIQRHPPLINGPDETQQVDWDAELFDRGLAVPVDLKVLVERIVLSPTAPKWFEDVIRSVVERYGHGFPVARSHLARTPRF